MKSVDGSVYLFDGSPRVNEFDYSARRYEPVDYYGDMMQRDHFMNRADFNLLPQKNGDFMTRSPYILYKHDSSYEDGFNPDPTAVFGGVIFNNPTDEAMERYTTPPADGEGMYDEEFSFDDAKQAAETAYQYGMEAKALYDSLNSSQKQEANSTQRQRSTASKATAKQFWNGWVKVGNQYKNVTEMSIDELTQFAQQMLSVVEAGRFSKLRLSKSWYNQQLQNQRWPIGAGLIAALNYWTTLFELERRNVSLSMIKSGSSGASSSKMSLPVLIGLGLLVGGGAYFLLRKKRR